MRIEKGPAIEEIRESINTGKVVTFGCHDAKHVQGVVLSAVFDHELNRAAVVLEEVDTHMLFFARYRQVDHWTCGDIVKWEVERNQIEELRRKAS